MLLRTTRLATGGLMAALIMVFLLVSSISPTGDLTIMSLASVCIAVTVMRTDLKTAVYVYLVSALIAIIWPGLIFSVPFIFVFGPWPLAKALLERRLFLVEKIGFRQQLPVKLVSQLIMTVMAGLAAIVYLFILNVNPLNLTAYPWLKNLPQVWVIIVLFAAAQIVLWFYDWALTLLITWYTRRLHTRV